MILLGQEKPIKNHTENSKLIKKLTLKRFSKIMEAFLDLVKDVWDFFKTRKKYWLAPLIITIILMGALIVFTQGSVIAPFIYSIF